MYVVVGGTGHVGSAVAKTLIGAGEPVTIVTRDPKKAEPWKGLGATVAVADICDAAALREVFRSGRRAFLLNPPADVTLDTDHEELRTVSCLLHALDGSGLEKVVAQSTMGARPGDRLGDLNTLHALEEGLKRQAIPAAVIRAAYYYSNWDAMAETAANQGVISSMLPADLKLPMVAPEDLGQVAARLLRGPVQETRVFPVEGPERYSPADVAAAFSVALDRPIRLRVAPRETWESEFRQLGFSEAAAQSYARMTAVTVDELERPENPIRGTITLNDYIAALVR